MYQPRNTAFVVQVNGSSSTTFESLQGIYKLWKSVKDVHEISLASRRHLVVYQINFDFLSGEYEKVCSIFQFPDSIACKILENKKAEQHRQRCSQSSPRSMQEIGGLLLGSSSVVLICDWWGISQQELIALEKKNNVLRKDNQFIGFVDDDFRTTSLRNSLNYGLEFNYFFLQFLQNNWFSMNAEKVKIEIVVAIGNDYGDDDVERMRIVEEWLLTQRLREKKKIYFLIHENALKSSRLKVPEFAKNHSSFLSSHLGYSWLHFYEFHLLLTVPVVLFIGKDSFFDMVKEQRRTGFRVADYLEEFLLHQVPDRRDSHRYQYNPTYSLGLNEAIPLVVPSLQTIEAKKMNDNLLAALVESVVIAWIHVIESATVRRRLVFACIVILSVIIAAKCRKNQMK